MKCPCCGATELVHETRDLPYTYKGKSTTIPSACGDFCPTCGEVIFDATNGDRYASLTRDFQNAVNGGHVD
jgi:HTH-type transcriptional regulator/antitoxin MqsA